MKGYTKILVWVLITAVLLDGIRLASAIENHESGIEEGKKLVESAISCDKLTNEQFEEMGDYYMEQMHPSEAHEYMDRMMGGEGSESLKQMHINIARSIYCNEDVGMGNMMGSGMMGGNMMMNNMMTGGVIDRGMMAERYGNYNSGFVIISYITYILMIILIVSAVYWLIKSANSKSTGRKLDERR